LWSRNFATMVTWCHTSPLYWFGQKGFRSGGGGLPGLFFAGYVLLASQNPYPVTVYSLTYYRLLAKCNFHHPNLITSCLICIYLKKPFNNLLGMLKWLYTFVKVNEVKIFPLLNPYLPEFSEFENPERMCLPTLVPLLKMQPHYSQSSHENVTLSSSTSPLAYY